MGHQTSLNFKTVSFKQKMNLKSKPVPWHVVLPRWEPVIIHNDCYSNLSSITLVFCASDVGVFESVFGENYFLIGQAQPAKSHQKKFKIGVAMNTI